MANRNSVQVAKQVAKQPLLATDAGGRAYPLAFTYVVVTEVTTDTVSLVIIPANYMVVAMDLAHDAAASTAVIIGDAASTNRYMPSQSWAAAGQVNTLPVSGQNYKGPTPAADVTVILTWVTVNPTVGANIVGVFWVVPAV